MRLLPMFNIKALTSWNSLRIILQFEYSNSLENFKCYSKFNKSVRRVLLSFSGVVVVFVWRTRRNWGLVDSGRAGKLCYAANNNNGYEESALSIELIGAR